MSTVLIVDDAKANIDILVETLSRDCYELLVALDGLTALELAAEELPDIILLDVMMPEMDGYQVCSRLKEREITRKIPVIFITSLDDEGDETKGFALGAVDYITKPIQSEVVRARVKTHLELKKSREQLEKQNEELILAAQLREDVERITRHDLKTPLDTICGFPEIIALEGNLTPDQLENLQLIEDAGYRMLNMINLSLDLFKMERGLYQFSPQPVNMIKIILKLFRENESLISIKSLHTLLQVEGRKPSPEEQFLVAGEELLCYSLLANLIKNALEACPEHSTISVWLNYKNDRAIIQIHNPGSVPPEMRERFFDKYATAGKSMGTGLGTYSARLITQTQNGRISFTSSEEEGTSLFVELDKI